MSRVHAEDINRAQFIDSLSLRHSLNRRTSTMYLLKIYPRKDEARYPKTFEFGPILTRIGEEYGEEAKHLAQLVFTQDTSLIPALLYLHDHWPAESIDINASYTDKAFYFGINQKTFERFWRNEGIKMKPENIWKLIIGMHLTPDQAMEFMQLIANQRSDMDCALTLCLDVWNREDPYPDHDRINQYLQTCFGDQAQTYLYQDF